MYFNATENTMKIWIITVIAIITLYECAKYLISLMIIKSVRYSMVFLFCLSIFSHYYAWWAYVNYYNDDFYSQWNHQMFFTVNMRFPDANQVTDVIWNVVVVGATMIDIFSVPKKKLVNRSQLSRI